MELTLSVFLFITLMAFCCEFIDSSLGMGYGTILSPVLLILGFDPIIVIPSILLSQAAGGLTASLFHHRFRNVDFNPTSRDSKIVFVVTAFGILATIFAAVIALNIPKIALKTYIGILVLAMGALLLSRINFKFSWKKIMGVGILSAFNKGLTGGGFGPVVTSGQIISGQDNKGAIGVTTLAEVPICTVGFLAYMIGRVVMDLPRPILDVQAKDFIMSLFSQNIFKWDLILALLIGSVLVAPFGALTTKIIKTDKVRIILGFLVVVLGAWTLIKTYF